jgi:hypothetical protein
MKSVRRIMVISLVLLGLAGCSVPRALRPQPDPMEIPPPVASADDLRARLGAANQISSVNLRDQTLAALALEAAHSALPELIRQALLGINAMNLRDNVTADCATRLGRQGRSDLGLELAGLISSGNLRDQVLSQLATGK